VIGDGRRDGRTRLRQSRPFQFEDPIMTEQSRSMLALLVAQAEGQGAGLVTLRALIEEASELGAQRALGALGLTDAKARRDMDELRELLQAWRDAKKSAWQAAVSWAVRILLALLVLGMSVRLGLLELLK
jgi:Family of unknown function (DUF6127)